MLETSEVPELDEQIIRETLAGMVGTLRLPVSAYSAIKREGVPMYVRARAAAAKGEVVTDVLIRDMEVYEAEYIASRYDRVDMRLVVEARFFVGSGTYVRSLAEELGKRLGYPATLQNLRRTRIGAFRVENAERV